jgi:Uma2 family endonuclease
MPGAGFAHNRLTANLVTNLGNQLREGPCQVVGGDQRVHVSSTGLYTYPDVVVVCGEPQFEDAHLDTLLNPTLIIEVLSAFTEAYDRGDKFGFYRELESLREYVLVDQRRPRVERFLRQPDGSWLLSVHDETGEVELISIACRLALADVYRNVPMSPAPDEHPSPDATG